jgi:paraquat-inducible protein B
MYKKIKTLLIVSLLLLGCKDSTHDLKIRYNQISGLKEGDRVIFEQNHIGDVTGILYSSDGFYLVDIAIKENFANAATENSKFFITTDPRHEDRKAIEVIQVPKGGAPLEEGATIEGSAKSSVLFDKVWHDLEKRYQDLNQNLKDFSEDLNKIPDSEEYKKLENELDRLTQQLKQSTESMKQKIQTELLPLLREKIEKLREQLRKFGREKELKPLETRIKKMNEI